MLHPNSLTFNLLTFNELYFYHVLIGNISIFTEHLIVLSNE